MCAFFFFFFGWKIAWLRRVDLLPNSLGKQTITIRVGVLCLWRVWGNTNSWSCYGLPNVCEERCEGDGMRVKMDLVPETPSNKNLVKSKLYIFYSNHLIYNGR